MTTSTTTRNDLPDLHPGYDPSHDEFDRLIDEAVAICSGQSNAAITKAHAVALLCEIHFCRTLIEIHEKEFWGNKPF
jgi:hypothetical protein